MMRKDTGEQGGGTVHVSFCAGTASTASCYWLPIRHVHVCRAASDEAMTSDERAAHDDGRRKD